MAFGLKHRNKREYIWLITKSTLKVARSMVFWLNSIQLEAMWLTTVAFSSIVTERIGRVIHSVKDLVRRIATLVSSSGEEMIRK